MSDCSDNYDLLYDRDGRVLLVRFASRFSHETIVAMEEAARRFVACHGDLPAIADFSQVDQFAVSLRAWREIARRQRVIRDAPRVLVAPQDSIFGLLRVYATVQTDNGDPAMVVRSLAEACAYLGLHRPDFQPLTAVWPQPETRTDKTL